MIELGCKGTFIEREDNKSNQYEKPIRKKSSYFNREWI